MAGADALWARRRFSGDGQGGGLDPGEAQEEVRVARRRLRGHGPAVRPVRGGQRAAPAGAIRTYRARPPFAAC